jgi:uncharacterized repeat protein (TIGR04052 family)
MVGTGVLRRCVVRRVAARASIGAFLEESGMRLGFLAVVLAACGGVEEVSIPFVAQVAGEAFRCDGSYAGVGLGSSTIRPMDLRMYVHDVRLILEGGDEVEVDLEEGPNQADGVVLLDFEDDSGACETGSGATWTTIVGTAPGASDAVGVAWRVGVPEALNHLDAATTTAPFNEPGMWWSWAGGYKYLKLDVQTDAVPSFFFHLGATDCDGTPGSGFTCSAGHVADIEVEGWSPGSSVVIDVATLFEGVNVDGPPPEGDGLAGCMSFPDDPECAPMFAPLGIGFNGGAAPGEQTLFTVGTP